jgi:hypothetical protein
MASQQLPRSSVCGALFYGSDDHGGGHVTPITDTNGLGPHDPLSDVLALFPEVEDYIRQLCGIF